MTVLATISEQTLLKNRLGFFSPTLHFHQRRKRQKENSMGLSCTKQQGLKKEKLQGPKKKPAHLRVWRKLRKLGKKDKAVLSMDEASGVLAKGTENQSPGPKSTKSGSELVKLAPEQNEAPKTDIKPVEDRERSEGQEPTGEDQEMVKPVQGLPKQDMEKDGGIQEPTGETQNVGEQKQGPPVEDMEKGGKGQEPTGKVQEMGKPVQGLHVEVMEKDGGGQGLLVDDPDLGGGGHGSFEEDPDWGGQGQGPPDQKPSTTKWHRFFRLLQSMFNALIVLAVDTGEGLLDLMYWLIYYMSFVYIEVLVFLLFYIL